MCMMAELSKQLTGLKSSVDQLATHLEYLDEQVAQIVSSREINEREEDSSDSDAEIETPQVEEIKLSLIVQPEEDAEPESFPTTWVESEAEEVNLEEDDRQWTPSEMLALWKLVEELRPIMADEALKRKYYGMDPVEELQSSNGKSRKAEEPTEELNCKDAEEGKPDELGETYDLEWMFSSDGQTREVEMLDEDEISSNGKTRESGVLMERVVPSNGKSRTTIGQDKDQGPSMDSSPLPKRVKVHGSVPIDPGKDPGKSLRPSHKRKEKVNSKCSQVWRVKRTKSNRAFLEKNKSGGEPDSKNKRFKPGWDPPAIPTF